MNKTELVAAIADVSGQTKTAVEAVLKAQTDVITKVVAGGDKVALTGLVSFDSRDVAERAYPIPNKPGETTTVAAHKAPSVKTLKPLKDALKA